MLPLAIVLVGLLALGSGVASNWQAPSGWQTPKPKPGIPPTRGMPKVPARGKKKR